MTYREFNEKANSLARLLRSSGVGKGSHVAILLPRSEVVFLAIMGVLKAGAAYVPIDPRSPTDRINYIIEDANASMVITDSMLKNQNNLTHKCLCRSFFWNIRQFQRK
jgi:non-ribosomal peptide synthetase component F